MINFIDLPEIIALFVTQVPVNNETGIPVMAIYNLPQGIRETISNFDDMG